MINLYHGDCLELMKDIKDKSIDMILCDLPYGTTACKWDKVIPFDKLWEQYNRIIKDNGAICLFGTEPFSSKLRMSNLKNYKYDWVWIKEQGVNFAHAKNMPLKNTENISVFSKGAIAHYSNKNRMIYNPQDLIPLNKTVKGTDKDANRKDNHKFSRKSNKENYIREFTNYPNVTIKFNSVHDNVHPTQKPVALLEYLIKTYTNEGETVLDNCMGSGSTGVASVHTNRNFIGIELDKDYFEIAVSRIN